MALKLFHLGAFLLCAASGSAEDLRYRFKVGQELVYSGGQTQTFESGAFEVTAKTTLWVTRQNPSGSWEFVGHSESTTRRTTNSETYKPKPRTRENFAVFEVFPDGRIAGPVNEAFLADMLVPLFRLPATTDKELRVAREGGDTSTYRLRPGGPEAKSVAIEKTDAGLLSEIYLSSAKWTGTFDRARGMIVSVDLEFSQGWGFAGKGTGRWKLTSAIQRSPEWIAQLAREARSLVEAQEAVANALKTIGAGKSATGVAAEQDAALQAAKRNCTLPVVAARFASLQEEFQRDVAYAAKSEYRNDELLNQPSEPWETTDLDGATHALAGYRGKVVVLDFWYRGCGWCIKAMPQLKEVVAHYRGQPVAVLGINSDRAEADARFVMQKLDLNYPTLKARQIPQQYHVSAWPTLILLDREGIVRRIHVGYSPNLRAELIGWIDELLGNPP